MTPCVLHTSLAKTSSLPFDCEPMTLVPNTAIGPQSKLAFDYDARGRRIRKQVWNNPAGTGSPTNDLRFVYEGWNLIGTLNSSLSLLNSYAWGLDLSGSLQGAGGVGGLLVASEILNGVVLNSYLPAFDGNGNVAALIKAGDGTESARYEYGPFGEVIRMTGPMANANPFRFSTKFQDDETDLLYYGYRYYNASTGRWLTRDLVLESGFSLLPNPENDDQPIGATDDNLYVFVANNSISQIDPSGLAFYAIDGTWTDSTAISNPWLLNRWTKEFPKGYYRGPKDGPTGSDTLKIAFNVHRDVCKDYCSAGGKDFTVNLTGWSRGAVAAVTVADLLRTIGCDCGCGRISPIPVNWVGLFDAVKRTPSPLTTSTPSNIQHFYHAIKTATSHMYPTLHYAGAVEHEVSNYKQPYKSTHGDVGISLARTPLATFWKNDAYHWIENSAITSGVKF